jgi:hypothetical protein
MELLHSRREQRDDGFDGRATWLLRGYLHLKSADWAGNHPDPLEAWKATELAKMPIYYTMDNDDSMRQTVSMWMAKEDPGLVREKGQRWLSDAELVVYVEEYARNGFQAGLHWYRVQTQPNGVRELEVFGGKRLRFRVFSWAGGRIGVRLKSPALWKIRKPFVWISEVRDSLKELVTGFQRSGHGKQSRRF